MCTDKYGGVDRGGIQAGRIIPAALPWVCRRVVWGVKFFFLDLSGFQPWVVEICEAARVSMEGVRSIPSVSDAGCSGRPRGR